MSHAEELFLEAAEIKSFDLEHRKTILHNISQYDKKVVEGKEQFSNLELAQTRAAALKQKSIENLDKMLLQAGMFNAGFIGLSQSQKVLDFLRWWESRTANHGILLPNLGFHFDQRWLDLAPGYIEELCVLRDPGVNVAYFNLSKRSIEIDNGDYVIDGSKLKLIHFSGFDPERLPSSNVYAPEVAISNFGVLESFFRSHADKLLALGWTRPNTDPKMKSIMKFCISPLLFAKKSKIFRFFWSLIARTSTGKKIKFLLVRFSA